MFMCLCVGEIEPPETLLLAYVFSNKWSII